MFIYFLYKVIVFFSDILYSTRSVFTSPGFLIFMIGMTLLLFSLKGLLLSAFRYIEFYFRVPIHMVAFLVGELGFFVFSFILFVFFIHTFIFTFYFDLF